MARIDWSLDALVFNSTAFAIFLPLVFCAYWFLFHRSVRQQNVTVVVASYVFYGWWDWRFLVLIAVSTIVDFVVGLSLPRAERFLHRRLLMGCSLMVNLGMLGFFKYFNFFVDAFTDLFRILGFQADDFTIHVILPVGISFYTFQTLGYTIDVYRRKIAPTSSLISFMAYVSFFPQLVAGPIERSTSLLPQFATLRRFDDDQARDGCRQMLWGFFKKIVVADNCALVVNAVFDNYDSLPASTLLVGMFCFTIQIYADFSGYSDIAIGLARLFGFDLMANFAYPFFSRSIGEFWRRWHISLSSWFREYLFAPLGGMRGGHVKQFRNLLILFVVIGFWHGANWTFIAYGLTQALLIMAELLFARRRRQSAIVAQGRWLPTLIELGLVVRTFALTCLASVIFRSQTVGQSFMYLGRMCDWSLFTMPDGWEALPHCLVLLLVEWVQREKMHGLDIVQLPIVCRWMIYNAIIIGIFVFGEFGKHEFIYFQF